MLKNKSIAWQAIVIALCMLVATSCVLYFWATRNALNAELSHARTVSEMADAFRTLVANYGGIYVKTETPADVAKIGRFLRVYPSETVVDGKPQTVNFHQKNPFLSLADFSSQVQASPAKAKFKLSSENYMNPDNAPSATDQKAIDALRQSNDAEYWFVQGGTLNYARPLRAAAACMTCHGDPAKAPASVLKLYPAPAKALPAGGYGYREGEVVGITMVTVPHLSPMQMLAAQGMGFWVSLLCLVAIMGGGLFLLWVGILRPLRSQTRYANHLASNPDPASVRIPKLGSFHADTRNELAQQHRALTALHESLVTAHRYLARGIKRSTDSQPPREPH